MTSNPIAIQLYTLRDQIATNYAATLQAVAELGYRAVELAGLGNYTAKELRAELDNQGLIVSSMHVPLTRIEGELDVVIEEALTLGSSYVVCPYLPEDRRGADGYRATAQTLNTVAEKLQPHGLKVGYHNHAFEFEPIDGSTGFDILFAEADASLVKLELDVYWAAFAGHDPVTVLKQYGSRAELVHLKDMAAESRDFAELGEGTLDIPAILAAADEIGSQWLIVEQDRCQRPPLESIGISLTYLRSLGRA